MGQSPRSPERSGRRQDRQRGWTWQYAEAFVDRTVRMAGLGLLVESRLPDLGGADPAGLLAALPPPLSGR